MNKSSIINGLIIVCLFSSGARAAYSEGILVKESVKFRNMGYEAQAKGDMEKALECYQKAVSLNPYYATAHNDLAVVYEKLGRDAEAEGEYKAALNCDPSYLPAYSNMALFYEKKKEPELAAFYWMRRANISASDDKWTQRAKERFAQFKFVDTGEGREASSSQPEAASTEPHGHAYRYTNGLRSGEGFARERIELERQRRELEEQRRNLKAEEVRLAAERRLAELKAQAQIEAEHQREEAAQIYKERKAIEAERKRTEMEVTQAQQELARLQAEMKQAQLRNRAELDLERKRLEKERKSAEAQRAQLALLRRQLGREKSEHPISQEGKDIKAAGRISLRRLVQEPASQIGLQGFEDERNKLEKARRQLEKAKEREREVKRQIALAQQERVKLAKARKEASEVRNKLLKKTEALLRFQVVEASLEEGEGQEGKRSEPIGTDKLRAKEFYNQGKLYYERGDFKAALDEFQKALDVDPDNETLLRCVTLCKKRLAETKAAGERLPTARSEVPRAKQREEVRLQERPQKEKPEEEKAEVKPLKTEAPSAETSLKGEKDREAALRFARTVARRKTWQRREDKYLAERCLNQAKESYGNREYKEALERLELGSQLDPTNKQIKRFIKKCRNRLRF